jgi:hypothetical protein
MAILDIFKTHFADDTNVLYRNDGKGNFDDVTIRAGIGVETRYVGWGAGMADLDNDGFPDIFMVTGSVYPKSSAPCLPIRSARPRLVFRNLGDGRFEELIEEAGSGVAATHTSRGCAFGDFDNDGDVDILVMNMNEPPSLCATTSRRRPLAEGAARRASRRTAAPSARASRPLRRSGPGPGSERAIQLLLGERPAPSLRPWHGDVGGADDPMAQRQHGDHSPSRRNQLVVVREGAGILRTQRFK